MIKLHSQNKTFILLRGLSLFLNIFFRSLVSLENALKIYRSCKLQFRQPAALDSHELSTFVISVQKYLLCTKYKQSN